MPEEVCNTCHNTNGEHKPGYPCFNATTPHVAPKRLVTFKDGRLVFAFPKDTEMNARLATAPGRTFIFERGAWALPLTIETMKWIRDNTPWIRKHGFEFTTNAKRAVRYLVQLEHEAATAVPTPPVRPLHIRATRLGCRIRHAGGVR